jgi:CRP-like cAMP-binding protein
MLEIVTPGSVFGELSIFGADPHRTASVVTLEAGETHSVDAGMLLEMCGRFPDVARYFMGLLAERSVQHTTRLLEIVFVPAEIRVVRRIVELAAAFPDGIALTQEQVGEMACTSRATVNKVLRAEAGRGALELGRRTVTINDIDLLIERASRGTVPPHPGV